MFKYVEVHDSETDSEILIKISPKKDIEFFIDSENFKIGNEIIKKLKSHDSLIGEIIDCKKRSTIKNFSIVPIG